MVIFRIQIYLLHSKYDIYKKTIVTHGKNSTGNIYITIQPFISEQNKNRFKIPFKNTFEFKSIKKPRSIDRGFFV